MTESTLSSLRGMPQNMPEDMPQGAPEGMSAPAAADPSVHAAAGTAETAEEEEEELDRCSPESLVRNFTAIVDDADYRPVMDILGVGGLQFNRRKLLKREFRALYIGLWRLALMRSFPDQHAAVFQAFMENEAARCKNRREAANSAQLVLQYVDKLREHGDADFSDVSRHVLSLLEFDETRTRAMILKLALHLRRMYTHFFDHLL